MSAVSERRRPAKGKRSSRTTGDQPVLPKHIVGNAEVRRLAGGITRHTLISWREHQQFPPPIRTLECGELWDATQVRAWLRARDARD